MNDPTNQSPPPETLPTPSTEPPRSYAASGFRRLALVVLASVGVMVLVAIGVSFALYAAATADVPEYEAVVEVDPVEAETARKELESQLSTLASETQTLPEWTSRITARQINAWLALRLERDMPGFAQAGLIAPRVVLTEGQITVAARSTANRIDGVIVLTLAPMITDSGDLALDIVSARIGRLSLPLEPFIAQLRETPLAEFGPIRFAVNASQAAIVVDLDRIRLTREASIRLTGLDVRDGELLLRGESATPKTDESPRPQGEG